MFDKVGSVADDARHQHLARRQLRLLPHAPLMLVPHVAGLEGIGLRLHLEYQVDDVLERQVVGVRPMPAAPAQVVAHLLLGNADKRVVDGIDAQPGKFTIGLDRRFRLQHVPPVGQAGVVDLQYEPCRHHRPIFLAQGVGQSEQELFLGLVVFIEDEVVEPARCEHRDERLLDGGARALNRGLERVELAIDGFGPLRFDRAAGDDAHCNRWHRFLAGDQEQRSGVVHVGVEIWKFVTFSGRMPRGRRLAWSDGARLNAGEMRGVMGEAAGCPELAIADAIDPGFELAPHGFRDGWCDLRGDDHRSQCSL